MATNKFPADGHVGIHTLYPKVSLDVRGHVYLADGNNAGVLYFPETGNYPHLYIRSSDNPAGGTYKNRLFIGSNDRVGIGTGAPSCTLDVHGAEGLRVYDGASGGSLLLRSDGTGQTRAIFGASGYISGEGMRFNVVSNSNSLTLESKAGTPIVFAQGGSEVTRISNNGKMGIGYNAPTQELSVKGNAYVSDGLSVGVSSPEGWKLKVDAGGVTKTALSVRGVSVMDGKLAVGTQSTPQAHVEVWSPNLHKDGVFTGRGNMLLHNPATSAKDLGAILTFGSNFEGSTGESHFTTRAAIKGGTSLAGNTGAGFLSFSTVPAGWAHKNTERMRIDHRGFVGIGLTEPEEMLDVYGKVYARSGIKASWQLHVEEDNTRTGTYIQPAHIILSRERGADTTYHVMFSDDDSETLSFWQDSDKREEKELMALQPTMQYLPGNVGIGTLEPTEKLDVDGKVYARSGMKANWELDVTESNTKNGTYIRPGRVILSRDRGADTTYHVMFSDDDSEKLSFWQDNDKREEKELMALQPTLQYLPGNVGIGTLKPAEKLEVKGRVKVNDWDAVYTSRNEVASTPRDFHLIGTYHGWSEEDVYVAGYNHYNPMQGDPLKSAAKRIFFGWQKTMTVDLGGKVEIGLEGRRASLKVNGDTKIKGDLQLDGKLKIYDWEIGIPDYVFDPNYELDPLEKVEAFVKKHRHLPGIAGEKEIRSEGLDLAELSLNLLKKVEELTLHLIKQEKTINQLLETKAARS